MEGLIKEGEEAMEAEGEDALVDSELIAAAQRVEHYEIAAYGCMAEYADKMGLTEIAALLNETLEEEKAADRKLTEVNEQEISVSAYAAGMAMAGGNGGSFRGSSDEGGSGRSASGSSGSSRGNSGSRGSSSSSGSSGSSGKSSSSRSSSSGSSGRSGRSGSSPRGRNGGSKSERSGL